MLRWASLALVAPVLLGAAAQDLPKPTTEQIANYVKDPNSIRSYLDPLTLGWENDLRAALKGGNLTRAADALAPKYSLSREIARKLALLTVLVSAYSYAPQGEAILAEARRRLIALVATSGRSPLVLAVAADSSESIGACPEDNFNALMRGSTSAAEDAWRIAENASCGANYLRFIAAAPNREMPGLIRLAHYGTLHERLQVPLYAWLTSEAALARIDAADRAALSAVLFKRYLDVLFSTGLTERAVAVFEAQPAAMQARILDPSPANISAMVDGLPLRIAEDRADESVNLYLAAAYAVAGRQAEAEGLYATSAGAAKARAAFACSWSGPAVSGSKCEYDHGLLQDWNLVDHLLHRASDDPYPLAETIFAGSYSNSNAGSVAELRCKVFADLGDICANAREIVASQAELAPDDYKADEDSHNLAALNALALPGFAENLARTEAEFAAVRSRYGGKTSPHRARTTVKPAQSPFAELPLPKRFNGPRPEAGKWPAGMSELPEGFSPVRVERSGNRAVAVSLSQNYDPTGEITGGGYWIHLSEDGGKSWRAYYSGLAQNFPYEVSGTSRMPLINGDMLDIEVEIAEIDTASITYPPVGLRTARRASGLYLQIPLADLTRDSDGDGMTDIAAKHLLLDQARTDGETPFVVGTTPNAQCRAPLDPEKLALMALLEKIFSVHSAGIVEPIDAPADIGNRFALWGRVSESRDRPILIKGDPRDYACLRPDRLMIVYGDGEIEQLQRSTPDFRTVELPRIVYNRARDRGYVQWSAGWTGGTYRLRRIDGVWKFDSISEWIT